MNESLPKVENNEEKERRLLRDAEYVVNSMWKKAMDTGDLPLSVDLSYQTWLEDLEKRKSEFVRILFKKAREETGEEKLRLAQTLKRLIELLGDSESKKLLKELLTNKEAIEELVNRAEEEIILAQTRPEQIKSKFKKKIGRLSSSNDDFKE